MSNDTTPSIDAAAAPRTDDHAARIAREQVRQRLFGSVGAATTIGRFQVLEQIGVGGMGTVFAAYDPRLDRKIALKLLGGAGDAPGDQGHARLLREARIMAKLDHPNVVAVHDVGQHEDGVYVAMEFVRGRNFAQWLEAEDPPWQVVVERHVQAGRGLAAAHRAGVLHRDFKPSNVMIDDEGRVRVLDFGLAAIEGEPARLRARETLEDVELTPSSRGSLTRTGMVLGTPLYFAPECIEGAAASPASDQYAFCISLWQALHGAHPFARRSLLAVHTAMLEGERPRVPSEGSGRVPTWVRAVVERGLAREPARRWPSMDDLVDALSRDPTRARRRWAWRGVAIVAIGGATLGAYRLGGRPDEPCALGQEALAGTWDDAQRQELRAAIEASAAPSAATVAPRVATALDDYGERWLTESRALCEATQTAGALSPAQQERRGACLEQRRRALDAMVQVLTHGDAAAVEHAVSAVEDLPAPEPCSDPGHLAAAEVPPPPELAERVRALEDTLAQLDARLSTGTHDGVQAQAEVALERARALEHPPTVARALLTHGRAQMSDGDYPEAEQTLRDAFLQARAHRVDAVARRSAGYLAHMLGITVKRPDDALLWAQQACAEAERAEDALGRASCLLNLGEVQVAQRQLDTAIATYREALEIFEREGGPEHTGVASGLNVLGNALIKAHRPDEAIEPLERARALRERILGPQHTQTANTLGYLGLAHDAAGRPERALEYQERALAILVAALGQEHPDVAVTYQNLARTLLALRRDEEALARTEQARVIWERVLGPQHPNVAMLHFNQGIALMELLRFEEAGQQFSRAHALLSEGPPALQAHACAALVAWAGTERKRARHTEALARAEQGLAQCEALQAGPDVIASARYEVAHGLVATGGDRERARSLAHRSHRALAELGPGYDDVRLQVEHWLAEHDPGVTAGSGAPDELAADAGAGAERSG